MEPTIAIVTALPVEAAAIRQFTGEAEEVQRPGDPNHYELSRLPSRVGAQPHPVVSTLLPRDGTRTAAAVAAEVLRSFPSVHCVLLCGVAGGVPAPNWSRPRVRLGDIVVATGGLVDYGHAWRTNGTDTLRRPVEGMSMELLRAANDLQSRERQGQRPWESLLDPVPRGFGAPAEPVPGPPQVHYGVVGSGDLLVQDTAYRDQLAGDHDVLAIEMEAAGIAAGTAHRGKHWFVVRGIADHCDPDRTSAWQPYAALAAASYTRILLGACFPFPRSPTGTDPGGGWPMLEVAQSRLGSPPQRNRIAIDELQRILDVLQTIPPLRDDLERQEFLAQFPTDIRAAIRYHSYVRIHLLSTIRACEGHPAGREAFLGALRIVLADGSDRSRCEQVIADNWRHFPGQYAPEQLRGHRSPPDGTP